MQDGQNLFDPATAFGGHDWGADCTADDLIRAGNIPPMIIVGINNAGAKRISEYTPTRDQLRRKGGKAERYAQMLAREVKFFIDHEFRTSKAASMTGVGGSSLGGLVSLQAALEYPRVFGNVAVMSPSVWWDNRVIVTMVRNYKGSLHPKIWLDIGTQEGDHPHETVADTRLLRDAFIEKGWEPGKNLFYCEAEGAGHNEAAWAYRFGGVVKFLFGGQ